ncbi:MAG: hypothetical protein WAN75_37005 [Xanthobacteraceae bacterium]|jgi:hypothetical protein
MTLNTLYTFLLPPAMVTAAGLLTASPAASCSAFEGHPCALKLSRAFRHRSYGPDIFYPFGEDLRLTIHSAAEQAPAHDPKTPDAPQALDTVGALFATLRSCWVPPVEDKARPGMEMTVRFALKRDGEMIAPPRVTYATRGVPPETRDIYFNAIMDALHRCAPLPLTAGLAGEIAGVPIAVRFVDDRERQ